MEMHGSRLKSASRETVWAALNEPDILRASIPGCKELDKNKTRNLQQQCLPSLGRRIFHQFFRSGK